MPVLTKTKLAYSRPEEGAPIIHAPSIYGASPGKPILYRIPITGQRPIRVQCLHPLPAGLSLKEDTGILSGKIDLPGNYDITISASNEWGNSQKQIRLEIAPDHICRTPLLGWTSWNAFAGQVTEEDIRKSAQLLCSTRLADYGYQYVNIDSAWQGTYGGPYNAIQPNGKFPNMAGLCAEIHGLGLKCGIYSTPMQKAWGAENLPGCTRGPIDKSYMEVYFGVGQEHMEENNVRQWEEWGVTM